jgi:hypothetical protein
MLDKKIAAYSKTHSMLPTQPNAQAGLTAEELKVWYDTAAEEIRVQFNALIDELASSVGAAQIGFTGVGILSTNTADAILEMLSIAQAAQAGTILPEVIGETELKEYIMDPSFDRIGKDANDVFTDVRLRRPDGTLYKKSQLSGGTSPKYSTRTVTYYEADGVTPKKVITYALTYTGDLLTSEVKI